LTPNLEEPNVWSWTFSTLFFLTPCENHSLQCPIETNSQGLRSTEGILSTMIQINEFLIVPK
jgi:hypothetical protein